MLTGLPEEGYQHEQIVNLVWSHLFPKTTQTLYSDVIVLPMQRRVRSRHTKEKLPLLDKNILCSFCLLKEATLRF